jgi:hypothetical protein
MTNGPALQIKSLDEDARPARFGTRLTCVPAETFASSTLDRYEEQAPGSSPRE